MSILQILLWGCRTRGSGPDGQRSIPFNKASPLSLETSTPFLNFSVCLKNYGWGLDKIFL